MSTVWIYLESVARISSNELLCSCFCLKGEPTFIFVCTCWNVWPYRCVCGVCERVNQSFCVTEDSIWTVPSFLLGGERHSSSVNHSSDLWPPEITQRKAKTQPHTPWYLHLHTQIYVHSQPASCPRWLRVPHTDAESTRTVFFTRRDGLRNPRVAQRGNKHSAAEPPVLLNVMSQT